VLAAPQTRRRGRQRCRCRRQRDRIAAVVRDVFGEPLPDRAFGARPLLPRERSIGVGSPDHGTARRRRQRRGPDTTMEVIVPGKPTLTEARGRGQFADGSVRELATRAVPPWLGSAQATRIEIARRRAGLMQRELADRSGVARRTLFGIEHRRGCPSVRSLFRLARVLELAAEELVEPEWLA
jgi:DNA-binding XRE family transcriptional regulator